MTMLRVLLTFLIINIFSPAQASEGKEYWVSDWRLVKPVVHGFLGVVTFNAIPLFPNEWREASKYDPNRLASGAVTILENNRTVPFIIGISTGLAFLIMTSVFIYRRYKFRFAVSHFKQAFPDDVE